MPDPNLILRAMGLAAGLAAGLVLAFGLLSRNPNSTRTAVAWILGVGAGFYLGTIVLGIVPQVKLAEDRDRFLLLVLPAAIVAELIAAFSSVPRWVAWLVRAGVAALAGLALLWGSVYLQDLAGPDSRLWTREETAQWLGGLALALLALWALLGLLMHVRPARSVPLALAFICAGSAVTMMLSGSAINSQLGFPLAAGLVGATVASCVLPGPPRGTAAIGVGVVGLFALLVGGLFFAELPWQSTLTQTVGGRLLEIPLWPAAMLFAAPLLCLLTELPFVRRLGPWLRGGLQLLVVAIPVAFVVFQAQQKFVQESQAPGSPGEPSLEDYMNFGK